MIRCKVLSLTLTAIFFVPLPGMAADADPWQDYRFLLGDWSGEGKGAPGQGKGLFSFGFDLQGTILVRKHKTTIPAVEGRPASAHEDLLVIYRDPEAARLRAIYFDNEGHVIHYGLTVSSDKQTVVLLSDSLANLPRFRLSYAKRKDEKLSIKFEIAPPGKPDTFKTYVEGTAVRESKPSTGTNEGK